MFRARDFLKSWRIRMQTGLSALFLFVVIGLSLVLLGITGLRTRDIVRETSFHYVDEVSKRAVGRTMELFTPVQTVVATLAASSTFRWIESDEQAYASLPQFLAVLGQLPQLYSIYAGFDDGSWLQVAALDNVPQSQLEDMKAPAGSSFRATVIVVKAGQRQPTKRLFLNGKGALLEDRADPADDYDPRTRPWFIGAFDPDAGPIIDIYMSYYLRVPLYTVRMPLANGMRGVIAADILLTDLNRGLNDAKIGKTGVVFLFDDQDRLVAHPRMAEMMQTSAFSDPPTVPRLQNLVVAEHLWIVESWKRTGRSGYEIQAGGRDFVVSFEEVPLQFPTATYLAVVAPTDEFFQDVNRIRVQTMIAAAAVVTLTLPLVWWLGHIVARQVRSLAQENERIRHFEIDQRPWAGSHIREIDELGRSSNAMKAALAAFGRFVPRHLVRRLIESGEPLELGGRRREITLMFTDIEGFSTIADREQPERLMGYMSRYLATVTDVVLRHDGTVDKFIGDAVMAFWNAPLRDSQHVAKACAAALECRDRIEALNRVFAEEGWPPFRTRFGLHTGEAIVGNVGSSERMSYTAMGSTVNLAARLEQLNKEYGTQILASDAIRARAQDRFAFRAAGSVVPKGLSGPVEVFELLGDTSTE